jgi:hypothetical protein
VKRLLSPAVLAAVVAASGGDLVAHHGTTAYYDMAKTMELSGTVTSFVWANPHTRIFVDVTDGEGKVVNWGIEMRPAPNGLSRAGWTRHTFQPGDRITLTIFPSRFGTPLGVGEPDFPILKNGQQLPGTGRGRGRGA